MLTVCNLILGLGLLSTVCFTSAEDNVTFITMGDWGTGSPFLQFTVADQMALWAERNYPDFIMTTGDNFYMDGVASVDDRQFDWKWRNVYDHDSLIDLPWYLSIGNHDYGFEGNGVEWNQVWFSEIEPKWNMPHLWYSFYYDIGETGHTVHFIAIDTECLVQETNNHTEMVPWLERELEESEGDWLVVFGHAPVYTAGSYAPYVQYMREEIMPVLEKYGVHLYICGHDHNMQLLNYHNGTGTEWLVSGGGGTLVYDYTPGAEEILDKEFGIGTDYFNSTRGFVGVTLTQDQVYLEYVAESGEVLYEHTRDWW